MSEIINEAKSQEYSRGQSGNEVYMQTNDEHTGDNKNAPIDDGHSVNNCSDYMDMDEQNSDDNDGNVISCDNYSGRNGTELGGSHNPVPNTNTGNVDPTQIKYDYNSMVTSSCVANTVNNDQTANIDNCSKMATVQDDSINDGLAKDLSKVYMQTNDEHTGDNKNAPIDDGHSVNNCSDYMDMDEQNSDDNDGNVISCDNYSGRNGTELGGSHNPVPNTNTGNVDPTQIKYEYNSRVTSSGVANTVNNDQTANIDNCSKMATVQDDSINDVLAKDLSKARIRNDSERNSACSNREKSSNDKARKRENGSNDGSPDTDQYQQEITEKSTQRTIQKASIVASHKTGPTVMSQANKRLLEGTNRPNHLGKKHIAEPPTGSDIGQCVAQAQKQRQLQRSIEASKQLLYDVFGNVITILEEYEQREVCQFQMPKSDIHIPNQEHKTFNEVKSIVECQLLIFESQTKLCPPEVLSELREELKHRTLSWSAVRAEMGIKENQQTDVYITQLYEILAKGSTFHQPINMKHVTAEVMRKSFPAILKGKHDVANKEKEFKTNPNKKAISPKTRSSELVMKGCDRISRVSGDESLDRDIKENVKKYKHYMQTGQEDLK